MIDTNTDFEILNLDIKDSESTSNRTDVGWIKCDTADPIINFKGSTPLYGMKL